MWGQGVHISEAELVAGGLDLVYHNLSRMNRGASREHLESICLKFFSSHRCFFLFISWLWPHSHILRPLLPLRLPLLLICLVSRTEVPFLAPFPTLTPPSSFCILRVSWYIAMSFRVILLPWYKVMWEYGHLRALG